MHLVQGNPRQEGRLGEELIKSGPAERDLGGLVDEKLNKSQEFVPKTRKADCILGSNKSSVSSRAREGIELGGL